MKRIFFEIIALIALLLPQSGFAQTSSAGDDPVSSSWPPNCRKIEVISSEDGSLQTFMFMKASGKEARPLVVSLHTWSGGYDQKDTLVWQCLEKNYNYIHPDFRGKNDKPVACGSPEVIRDIDDALTYAINNANVDMTGIHVVGSSGGGYATLLAYMNSTVEIKTFSAWVAISDLVKWFYESEGRKSNYSKDISKVTGGWTDEKNYSVGLDEAIQRSPYYMKTPVEKRKFSKLNIYAGIHDGYTGSVPITHSLLFYNKVVKDFNPAEENALIPDQDILEMITSRNFRNKPGQSIGNRLIHYEKSYKDRIKITIFEGGHEQLTDVALDHLERKNILIIGDSNGAAPDGWVEQMKVMDFNNFIYNTSISGNTIGFDNNGQKSLNTLRNIDRFISEGREALGKIDAVVIMLGTNDCKAVFNDSLRVVPDNFEKMLKLIKKHPVITENLSSVVVVSPPPVGRDEKMIEKYHGGAARMAWLQPRFKKIADKNGAYFIDIYSGLLPEWDKYSKDGIHLTVDGQKVIAEEILKRIKKFPPALDGRKLITGYVQ